MGAPLLFLHERKSRRNIDGFFVAGVGFEPTTFGL